MEFEITLDRSYYSRSQQLLTWLLTHVGPGHVYTHVDHAQWAWNQQFGTTWIRFKHEQHLVQFKLTWC